jgi:hypothetical protein
MNENGRFAHYFEYEELYQPLNMVTDVRQTNTSESTSFVFESAIEMFISPEIGRASCRERV